MTKIQRLVLDVLKPHEPEIAEFTKQIAEINGVEGVNVSLIEVDEQVRNVKLTLEGDLDVSTIREDVEEIGASIHSIDEVAAGGKLVEESKTLQD